MNADTAHAFRQEAGAVGEHEISLLIKTESWYNVRHGGERILEGVRGA